MLGNHQFCHKTLPEIYYNNKSWLFSPTASARTLGVGFWEIREITSSIPFDKAWEKLANSFSLMSTYRMVAPELHSSDARKLLISNVALPWAPSYPFVLLELSLDLNDPSFLVFICLIIFIESNYKSIKGACTDQKGTKKRTACPACCKEMWGGVF